MNSAVCVVLGAFLFTYVNAVGDVSSLAQRALNSIGLTPAQINEVVAKVTAVSSGSQQTEINNYINSISNATVLANVTANVNEIEGIFNGMTQLTQQLLVVLAKYNISKDTINKMAQDVRSTWQTTQSFTAVQQVLIADINKTISGGSVGLLTADIVAMFKPYNTANSGLIQKAENELSNLFG